MYYSKKKKKKKKESKQQTNKHLSIYHLADNSIKLTVFPYINIFGIKIMEYKYVMLNSKPM